MFSLSFQTMAKSLSELRRLQRGQLSRINKEDLIESILAAPDPSEGLLQDMAEKFRDLVKEVAGLKQAVTSPDSNINKKVSELQDQVRKQAEVIVSQQRYLEAVNRKEREKNIIVTGVPDENEALESATSEEGKMDKIWAKVEAEDEIKTLRRLGNGGGGRRRPILVIVDSKEARDRILNKTQKLKQSGGEYSRIYIKKDVHPSIRMEWRRLREAEKKERDRPVNSGCVVRLDTRERKLYRDDVVIDQWNQQFF